MAHRSGLIINFTIKLDSGVLLLAKHRALLERTSVNRYLADALEDYADGTMDAARRTRSAAYVFGVVEEVRRLKRRAKAERTREVDIRRPDDEPPPSDVAPHQASFAQHERTTARERTTAQMKADGLRERSGRRGATPQAPASPESPRGQ